MVNKRNVIDAIPDVVKKKIIQKYPSMLYTERHTFNYNCFVRIVILNLFSHKM